MIYQNYEIAKCNLKLFPAQSAEAVEYTDCISAEW